MAAKRVDETGQDLRIEGCFELLLDPFPNHIQRGCAVELPGDEVLDLPDAEEEPGQRVLDDVVGPSFHLSVSEEDVPAKFCLGV